jgi:hypothetical protein
VAQVKFVGLSGELYAETVVLLFGGEDESRVLVDALSREKWMVGPETYALKPGCLCELERGVEQTVTESLSAGSGIDEQDP